MPVVIAFWSSLLVTICCMVVALVSGLLGGRRLHLWAGPATILCLAVTVVLAVMMGALFEFPPVPRRVHRVVAVTAGSVAILVACTGVLLLKRPGVRRWHRTCVLLFVSSAVLATGTGVWMWSGAVPR